MKKKELYTAPTLEIVDFGEDYCTTDIIQTSGGDGGEGNFGEIFSVNTESLNINYK